MRPVLLPLSPATPSIGQLAPPTHSREPTAKPGRRLASRPPPQFTGRPARNRAVANGAGERLARLFSTHSAVGYFRLPSTRGRERDREEQGEGKTGGWVSVQCARGRKDETPPRTSEAVCRRLSPAPASIPPPPPPKIYPGLRAGLRKPSPSESPPSPANSQILPSSSSSVSRTGTLTPPESGRDGVRTGTPPPLACERATTPPFPPRSRPGRGEGMQDEALRYVRCAGLPTRPRVRAPARRTAPPLLLLLLRPVLCEGGGGLGRPRGGGGCDCAGDSD